MDDEGHGAACLSKRLATFRKWLTCEANFSVHSSISIVNGEATDGTKNAPVLLYGRGRESFSNNTSSTSSSSSAGAPNNANASSSSGTRCGIIDTEEEQVLWDKTLGCQVRTVREVKKDDVLMEVPRSSMITPDIIAVSDAGRAVFQCCEGVSDLATSDPWEMLCGISEAVEAHKAKLKNQTGTQLLVNILRERKRAEDTLSKAYREEICSSTDFTTAPKGSVSTRAPFVAFLIHQRFGLGVNSEKFPSVIDEKNSIEYQSFLPAACPKSFAPYVMTFPSAFSLPICWKRNELALLSGCQGGFNLLVEIAANTMVLANDLIQLIKAGILHRFLSLCPNGCISWDTWVWATAAWTSRAFPVGWCFKKGESVTDILRANSRFNTLAAENVWEDMGVMIPLLDMLNHESDSGQIMWESVTTSEVHSDEVTHHLLCLKRVKKGNQICICYGSKGNQELIYQYGFAQIANPKDETAMSWALSDSVGRVKLPSDLSHLSCSEEGTSTYMDYVFESTDQSKINSWWTDKRLQLLKAETMVDDASIERLVNGKKLSAPVSVAGPYHPTFLAAAVVATMPEDEVNEIASITDTKTNPGIRITKKHQVMLRHHLEFFYKRKLEKLLSNLSFGLKAHFNNVQLWTLASEGGLYYTGESNGKIGWQRFFDTYAYNGAMEIEKRYYAIGADSCVLALYDGILRSVQASIEGTSEPSFKSILQQLVDLGFVLTNDNEGKTVAQPSLVGQIKVNNEELPTGFSINEPIDEDDISSDLKLMKAEKNSATEDSNLDCDAGNEEVIHESNSTNGISNPDSKKRDRDTEKGTKRSGGTSEGGRSRKRNKQKGTSMDQNRPAAIKLHIGNLSYATLPSALFEYFSRTYGAGNILECHIPTERATGKSRGFGFVTMPEDLALRVLDSDRKHEIQGRLLKIARSNTAGSGKASQSSTAVTSSDRCLSCGYRPKYCTCPMPKLPGAGIPGNALLGAVRMPVGLPLIPPPPPGPPPPMHHHFDEYPAFDSFGHRIPMGNEHDSLWGRSRGRDFSRSISPSHRSDRHGRRGREKGNVYERYDRDYRRSSFSPSRSRSYDREEKNRKRRKKSRSRSKDRQDSRSSSSDSDRESRRRKSDRSSRHEYLSSKQRSDDSDSGSGHVGRRRSSSRADRRERKRSRSNSRSRSRSRHSTANSRSRSDSRSRGSRSHRKSGEHFQTSRGRRL